MKTWDSISERAGRWRDQQLGHLPDWTWLGCLAAAGKEARAALTREESLRSMLPHADPAEYDAYRKLIEHEDELIGMRNGWLVGGESFLFTAYAAILTIQGSGGHLPYGTRVASLVSELPVVGIVLAAMATLAVWAALWRSGQVCRRFDACFQPPDGFPEIMSKGPRRLGHLAARLIAPGFIVAWAVLLWRS